jgi:putative transposase
MRIAWLRLMFAIVLLIQDAVRYLRLGTRSSAALKAEYLFLRKQLALYLERKAKPRRADDATRLSLHCSPGCLLGNRPSSSSGRRR